MMGIREIQSERQHSTVETPRAFLIRGVLLSRSSMENRPWLTVLILPGAPERLEGLLRGPGDDLLLVIDVQVDEEIAVPGDAHQ
jgi:hypothetical protein